MNNNETESIMNMNMNVVLVHGAWADGSCWSKVLLQLRDNGIKATAAQIPLTSLPDDIAVVRRHLSTISEPTILVGHSYGGAVISGAATGVSHVKGLVYITAFGLDEGESLESLAKSGPPAPGAAAIAPDDKGFLWIDRAKFHDVFAADATADEAYVMAAVQKPLSFASFGGKSGHPAWRTLPSYYLVCTDDKMIPPDAQQLMAKRMNAVVKTVPSSHAAFVAHSKQVTDIILLATQRATS
jgi:pimeloyl-ACP methyl ester carboxylesterase